MKEKQRTIKYPISMEGIGLHTGKKIKVCFNPAKENTGILIIRKDLNNEVKIPASVDYVEQTESEVWLKKDGYQVKMVEHMLSAVVALGIDNIIIELDGIEPPAMDGSSFPYVELLKKAQIIEQQAEKIFLQVEYTEVKEADKAIILIPQEQGLRISYFISFPNTLIGAQYMSLLITPESFEEQIAKARTFGFLDEVKIMKEKGLIKGGSLENAIIIDGKRMLNTQPLRYEDEFVRHKILDLIGDLGLIGGRINAHIIAIKSGHTLNIELVKHILSKNRENLIAKETLDITDIQRILPHRYPFLLIDKIIEYIPNKKMVGIKNITINEEFFRGHFPDRPVMPGVLIIEGMAQVGGMLIMLSLKEKNNFVYFTGINNAKFRKVVLPGDTIRYEVEGVKLRKKLSLVKAFAYVEDKLVAEAELMFSMK